MSSALARARVKYVQAGLNARVKAVETLRAAGLMVPFSLNDWSGRARCAYDEQWAAGPRHPDACWDWHEVFAKYRGIDVLNLVIWGDEEHLAGLAVATTTGPSVMLHFIEGDPREDSPVRGSVLLIVLQTAALYGQALGKVELRIRPINDELCALYTGVYGFGLETPYKELPYYNRVI